MEIVHGAGVDERLQVTLDDRSSAKYVQHGNDDSRKALCQELVFCGEPLLVAPSSFLVDEFHDAQAVFFSVDQRHSKDRTKPTIFQPPCGMRRVCFPRDLLRLDVDHSARLYSIPKPTGLRAIIDRPLPPLL